MPIVWWFPSGARCGPLAKRRQSGFFPGVMLVGALVAGCPSIALAVNCKPNHFRPAAFLHTMGRCEFDPAALSFRGAPADQARCLMRGVDSARNLGPELESLPPGLASRVGADTGLPRRDALSAYLSKQNLEWDFAAYLWQPLSRANDNDPNAPMARYFVIHDTSGPNYGARSFPADIDDTSRINDLTHFECSDGHGKAHVVVNRVGGMLLNHELATPWRETKFELAANFSGALKGLFLHTELVQPRRSASRRGRDDALAPQSRFHHRAIQSPGAALHRRQRARRTLAHPGVPRRPRRRHTQRSRRSFELRRCKLCREPRPPRWRLARTRGAAKSRAAGRGGNPPPSRLFPGPFPLVRSGCYCRARSARAWCGRARDRTSAGRSA